MPTPVGPAPRDPDDPDLWEEWYEGTGDEAIEIPDQRAWWVPVVTVVVVLALIGAITAGLLG